MRLGSERQHARMSPYVRSFLVVVVLGIATGIEYAIAITDPDNLPVFSSILAPLAVIALFKAGLIVYFYMHISRIWSPEEDMH